MVIPRQLLAHLPIADYKGVVNLPEMSDLDDVSKLPNFVVLGEFDTVRLVCTLYFL